MPRVRAGKARHRRKVRLFRAVKGYRGGRSKLYRTAKEALVRAGAYAYSHRRLRKRDFRSLWITRLSAACRMRGLSYSRFIFGLNAADVTVNRKMMSEIAIDDPEAFDQLVAIAQEKQPQAKVA